MERKTNAWLLLSFIVVSTEISIICGDGTVEQEEDWDSILLNDKMLESGNSPIDILLYIIGRLGALESIKDTLKGIEYRMTRLEIKTELLETITKRMDSQESLLEKIEKKINAIDASVNKKIIISDNGRVPEFSEYFAQAHMRVPQNNNNNNNPDGVVKKLEQIEYLVGNATKDLAFQQTLMQDECKDMRQHFESFYYRDIIDREEPAPPKIDSNMGAVFSKMDTKLSDIGSIIQQNRHSMDNLRNDIDSKLTEIAVMHKRTALGMDQLPKRLDSMDFMMLNLSLVVSQSVIHINRGLLDAQKRMDRQLHRFLTKDDLRKEMNDMKQLIVDINSTAISHIRAPGIKSIFSHDADNKHTPSHHISTSSFNHNGTGNSHHNFCSYDISNVNDFVENVTNNHYLRKEIHEVVKGLENKLQFVQSILCNLENYDFPQDCSELEEHGYRSSGIYCIQPTRSRKPFLVYCDMDTDEGGWTVLQRRMDNLVDFNRPWHDYKKGFGILTRDFWLGNDNIHHLTHQKRYTLRIDMEDTHRGKTYAKYNSFEIGSEDELYRINKLGKYSGTTGGVCLISILPTEGTAFSTQEERQFLLHADPTFTVCAKFFNGGWWYNSCNYYSTNLNGERSHWINCPGYLRRFWLRFTDMKVRPVKHNEK